MHQTARTDGMRCYNLQKQISFGIGPSRLQCQNFPLKAIVSTHLINQINLPSLVSGDVETQTLAYHLSGGDVLDYVLLMHKLSIMSVLYFIPYLDCHSYVIQFLKSSFGNRFCCAHYIVFKSNCSEITAGMPSYSFKLVSQIAMCQVMPSTILLRTLLLLFCFFYYFVTYNQ